jgi:hypothetical protein
VKLIYNLPTNSTALANKLVLAQADAEIIVFRFAFPNMMSPEETANFCSSQFFFGKRPTCHRRRKYIRRDLT